MVNHYDAIAIGAHPDDVEAVMGGTLAKLIDKGRSVLMVDLCDGEPARHAPPGERAAQAARAAEILGAHRMTLSLRDRMIQDTIPARLELARLIRIHRPSYVFTTLGSGIHPDHKAVTDIVVNGVFYARSRNGAKFREVRCFPGQIRMKSAARSLGIAEWSRPGRFSISR